MDQACQATKKADLEQQIMSSNVPKNEREWWAAHEIERLRGLVREAQSLVTDAAGLLDMIKNEWSGDGSWSEWDQSVRDRVSAFLAKTYN